MDKLAELVSTYVLFLSLQKGSPATYALGKGEMYTIYTCLQSIHFSARGPLHPNVYSMCTALCRPPPWRRQIVILATIELNNMYYPNRLPLCLKKHLYQLKSLWELTNLVVKL